MAKKFTLTDLSAEQGLELLAGISARLKALDKAFKACVKEGLSEAMEKVSEKISAANMLRSQIQETMSE